MIRGLWYIQTDSIIDVKLGDDDVDIYTFEPMEVILDWWYKTNKYKHGKH